MSITSIMVLAADRFAGEVRGMVVTQAHASPAAPVPAPDALRDGRHDFDFLHGTWRIHNRKLRLPLTGSSDWYEFQGRSVERPLWDGQANLEEYDATLPDDTPLRGLAIRLYDPRSRRWTIHWSTSANGTLDPPMSGAFRHGVGTFYSHEDCLGRMILVRFEWTCGGPDSARWVQAYSPDGGKAWETNWIMDFMRADSQSQATEHRPVAATGQCCAVIELRQYAMRPGRRDTLIELFEREFVETQEATGMQVVAQFRDIDRPDVFTWLRGFPDMTSRAASLTAFYGGPVWARHKNAANATMIDSDNVRLLRHARAGSGFVLGDRAGHGSVASPRGLVVATIYTLLDGAAADFTAFFERSVAPRLTAAGAKPFAMFETEPSPNTFPRLPVREGERAFVWFARFADVAEHARSVAVLERDAAWREVGRALEARFAAPMEVMRLAPTARSRELR